MTRGRKAKKLERQKRLAGMRKKWDVTGQDKRVGMKMRMDRTPPVERENELTDSRSRSRIKDGGGWTQLGEGKKDAAGDTVNESVPAADWTEDRKRRPMDLVYYPGHVQIW
ncbi:Uncharacterized protein HZ326_3224 [Fusarium oxysporum f. sp. albedinis]|nr:Uncharacterized protein HZ326_3224 [Fusarium oxysporum f. sp. albedinis]